MTATLGDFLVLAEQHISAAARHTDLPATARAEVIVELDRLVGTMTRYARDGFRPPGTQPPPRVPAEGELARAGGGLLLHRAAAHLSQAAQVLTTTGESPGHPAAVHLRSATECLMAGRDLVATHYDAGADPLWKPVLTAAPVEAVLTRKLASYACQLGPLVLRAAQPAPDAGISPTARAAACTAAG